MTIVSVQPPLQFFDHGCALTCFGANNIALDPDPASAPTGNLPVFGMPGSGSPVSNSLTLNLALSFAPAFDFGGEQNICVFGNRLARGGFRCSARHLHSDRGASDDRQSCLREARA
jgi:hypothetical protein